MKSKTMFACPQLNPQLLAEYWTTLDTQYKHVWDECINAWMKKWKPVSLMTAIGSKQSLKNLKQSKKCLLCAQHHSKWFTWNKSFHSQNSPIKWFYYYPHFKVEETRHGSTYSLSGRVGKQVVWFQSQYSHSCQFYKNLNLWLM